MTDSTLDLDKMKQKSYNELSEMCLIYGPQLIIDNCEVVDDYIAIFKVYPTQSLLNVIPEHIKENLDFKRFINRLKLKNKIEPLPEMGEILPIVIAMNGDIWTGQCTIAKPDINALRKLGQNSHINNTTDPKGYSI
ncbi:hypothetical protein [Pseudoalteromonas sp. GABNS16H]|uniref:hypothetical protein n=1 Tax=Pseudoalteromonas sp. GABNS16H TaxID=3025325 RepID=UPI0023601C98|nr:hypothetical protein [Pseudoalteromonas sp. GABNS16H]MDC9611693.1 hypothetical protein [Pseudoalteromonas sp. GABNS16H]